MVKIIKHLCILLTLLLLSACNSSTGFNYQDSGSTTPSSGASSSGGAITVFFTQPNATNAKTLTGGPETGLIAAIDKARTIIDIAIYELSLKNITQSLIRAHKRDVTIRILTDSDHLNWTEFKALIKAGITVKGDDRSALMHNKFTIIDNKQVWTGSMNYTYNGAYHHNENLLRLDSTAAALNYSEEFSQLWAGIHRQENAADSVFSISNTTVKVHFSPDDHFRDNYLLPLLTSAKHSVHFMAFAFTSSDIANKLASLKQQGIEIKGVFDKNQSGQSYSQYDDLAKQNIDVLLDGNSYKLHHKVMIIDRRYVVTGSYNFTQSAETRNDENSVIIDSTNLAASYEKEFSRVYQQGKSKQSRYTRTTPAVNSDDWLIDY